MVSHRESKCPRCVTLCVVWVCVCVDRGQLKIFVLRKKRTGKKWVESKNMCQRSFAMLYNHLKTRVSHLPPPCLCKDMSASSAIPEIVNDPHSLKTLELKPKDCLLKPHTTPPPCNFSCCYPWKQVPADPYGEFGLTRSFTDDRKISFARWRELAKHTRVLSPMVLSASFRM